jgi:hypothetical protein
MPFQPSRLALYFDIMTMAASEDSSRSFLMIKQIFKTSVIDGVLGQRIRSSVCLGLGKLLSCQSSASAVFEENTADLTEDFLKIFPV